MIKVKTNGTSIANLFENLSGFHFFETSLPEQFPPIPLKSFLSNRSFPIVEDFWSKGKQRISQLSRSQTIVLGGAVLMTVGLALVWKGTSPLLPIIGGASIVAGGAMMIAPNRLFTDASEFINDLKLQYQFLRISLKEVFNQPLFNN